MIYVKDKHLFQDNHVDVFSQKIADKVADNQVLFQYFFYVD